MPRSRFQPALDQLDLGFRSRNPSFRLFLKRVKYVDCRPESHRINSSIGLTVVSRHDLENARAQPRESLRVAMSKPCLRLIQGKADVVLHRTGKRLSSFLLEPTQTSGLSSISPFSEYGGSTIVLQVMNS